MANNFYFSESGKDSAIIVISKTLNSLSSFLSKLPEADVDLIFEQFLEFVYIAIENPSDTVVQIASQLLKNLTRLAKSHSDNGKQA